MFDFIKNKAEIINQQVSDNKKNIKGIATEKIDIPLSHYDLICRIKNYNNIKNICKILQKIAIEFKEKDSKKWWKTQHSFIRHACAEISKDTLLNVINENNIVLNNNEKSIILNKFYSYDTSEKSSHLRRHILGSKLPAFLTKDFDKIIEILVREADVDKILEQTYIEIICIAIIYLQIPDEKLNIYATKNIEWKTIEIEISIECNDDEEPELT